MTGQTEMLLKLLLRCNDAIIFYLLGAGLLLSAFLILSIRELIRFRRTRALVGESHLLQSEETPAISILTPVFNEELTIAEKVNALLRLHYPKFEVIIINDGSTDKTLKFLIDEFKLLRMDFLYTSEIKTRSVRDIYRSQAFERLTVIDKARGGRADALNAGINVARNGLFCVVNANTLLREDALLRNVYPFVRWKDKVAATSSIIRMVNGCTVDSGRVVEAALPKNSLLLFQLIEAARTFLLNRIPWNAMNAVLVLPDSFGIYRKDLVLEAGGYAVDFPGEDMEMVVRLQRLMREKNNVKGVLLLPQTVCWAEAPARLGELAKERARWQRGLMETLWKHKAMFLNSRYGALGLFSYPVMVLLEIVSPLAELAGYLTIALGLLLKMVQPDTAFLFLSVTLVFGFFCSACTILIEEALFSRYGRLSVMIKMIFMALIENFGFRQVIFLIRFKAMLGFLFRKKIALDGPDGLP